MCVVFRIWNYSYIILAHLNTCHVIFKSIIRGLTSYTQVCSGVPPELAYIGSVGISLKYMCCLVTGFRNRLYFSWWHISWIKPPWNKAWFDVKSRRLCVLANTKLYHRNLLLWISMKLWILVSTTLGLFSKDPPIYPNTQSYSWPK